MPPRGSLSRDAVLDAALRLVDKHGLGGLSMRRLGAELGVEGMSLYHYVESKADLLDGITSRVFEGIPIPDKDLAWDERLHEMAWGAFEAFSAHPEVMRAVAVNQTNPRSHDALRVVDALLAALLDAGMDEQRAARHYCELFTIVFAAVRVKPLDDDWPASPRHADGVDPWRQVSIEDFPHLHRVLPALLTLDRSTDFSRRLENFLNELRSSIHS